MQSEKTRKEKNIYQNGMKFLFCYFPDLIEADFKEKISDTNIYRLAKECFPGKIYKLVNGQGSMGCCPVLWISILKIVFSKTYLNIQKTFYM